MLTHIKPVILSAIATFSIGEMSQAERVLWDINDGGNDHEYEAVLVEEGIEFFDALAAAEAMGGHLATITTSAENSFVFNNVASDPTLWGGDTGADNFYAGPWLGGIRSLDASTPDSGWSWITGESWGYTNWAAGEPSTLGEVQMALHYFNGPAFAPPSDAWNDLVVSNEAAGFPVISFIVEYDPIPAPSSLGVLCVMGALSLRRRR